MMCTFRIWTLTANFSWTTPESPVHYVDVASEYTCGLDSCTAAFDGLHPNELGAYQIARAFSKTLIEHFSLGGSPIQVPDSVMYS